MRSMTQLKSGHPTKPRRSGTGGEPTTKRYLGFDPGIAITGYGVVERRGSETTCLTYGVIRTPKTTAHHERLVTIHEAVRDTIAKYKPNLIGVETLIFARNVTTAIPVGEARGVILLAIAEAKIPILELTPLQVKQALTSYGRAEKQQVQYTVRQILHLRETPQPDDAADALAVALATEQWATSLLR